MRGTVRRTKDHRNWRTRSAERWEEGHAPSAFPRACVSLPGGPNTIEIGGLAAQSVQNREVRCFIIGAGRAGKRCPSLGILRTCVDAVLCSVFPQVIADPSSDYAAFAQTDLFSPEVTTYYKLITGSILMTNYLPSKDRLF